MSGTSPAPVLEMVGASPAAPAGALSSAVFDLHLMAGECVLIDAQEAAQASAFADFSCGILPPSRGAVRFIGHDWARASEEYAAALRGRIGRLYGPNSWIPFMDSDTNILLPQLHHTRRSEPELREAATQLACRFGLPGLPTVRPEELSRDDLLRAACVRAFLGEPRLLIIEDALLERTPELAIPVLNALAAAKVRQAASIWLSCGDLLDDHRCLPVATRFRLTSRGLVQVREPT